MARQISDIIFRVVFLLLFLLLPIIIECIGTFFILFFKFFSLSHLTWFRADNGNRHEDNSLLDTSYNIHVQWRLGPE